jgi:hypothetical protein
MYLAIDSVSMDNKSGGYRMVIPDSHVLAL